MTDSLLALLPVYGPWLLGIVVFIASLGVPLPTAILVMTAGGFAASGDIVLWKAALASFAGFALADQVSYGAARRMGPPILDRLNARPRLRPTLDRTSTLLSNHGALAVILTKAVITPLGPYVNYVAGAMDLSWPRFTAAALFGAAAWTVTFMSLGYAFGDRISTLSSLTTKTGAFMVAGLVALATAWWLWRSWKAFQAGRSGS